MSQQIKQRLTAFMLLVALVLGACATPTPAPTPTPPPPPTKPPLAAPPPAPTRPPDTSPRKIQQAGKLVVGTSADYPPFESYNAQFQIDGFDIALINAVAQQLGVTVELHDFAFDGLGSAIQIGQIDTAISAISVTP